MKSKKVKAYDTEDGDKLLTYNALDTCATARVDREIRNEPDWNTDRVQRLFQIHEQLSKLGSEMHMTGFHVNVENRKRLIKQLKNLGTRRHNELVAHVGPRRSPKFTGSPDDMRALLYQRHSKEGIRCYEVTEPDAWDKEMWTDDTCTTLSVDKASLMRIFIAPTTPSDVQDAITYYWRAKSPGKALSTWVGVTNSQGKPTEIQQRMCDDGRCRPEWNSAGTETMRWAGELMTLPRDKDDDQLGGKLPNIRSMYDAAPGHRLLHWDWKQQELWVWAAVYKDPMLLAALRTGDVYSFDARQWFPDQLKKLFGKDWETVNLKKVWKDGRKQTKVVHLGANYWAGPPVIWTQGLLQDRKLQFHNVKILHAKMHKTYSIGFDNAQKEHSNVEKTGYSEGRILQGRRYYPAPPPITETCNYPVQRTAGEMGALTMLAIWETIKKEKMPVRILTNEHDAGTMEYKKSNSLEKELSDVVRRHAEGPWTIDGDQYTIPVDMKTGDTWAECTDD